MSKAPETAGFPPHPQEGLPLAQQFMAAFQKTVRSANLYHRNNTLLTRFQEHTFSLYQALALERGELEFGVRPDKLMMNREVVLHDSDRETGLPFRLFREGVRRLTLLPNMPAEEMRDLVGIFGGVGHLVDEDVVTLLWKAALPHVRYITVDIGSAAQAAPRLGAGEVAQDEDADADAALKEELNALLGAIYQGDGGGQGDSKGILGISIGADDLLALKALGGRKELELSGLQTDTWRELFPVPAATCEALRAQVESESDLELGARTLDVLLTVLFSSTSGADTKQVVEQLLAQLDALLLSRDFKATAALLERVRTYGAAGKQPGGDAAAQLKNQGILRHLTKVFTNDQRLTAVGVALNDQQHTNPAHLGELLVALGKDDPMRLVGMLPVVQNPAHRRLLCDTVVEIGVPPLDQLAPMLDSPEWFVGRDILYLLAQVQGTAAREHILHACDSPHPRLRQAALLLLAPFEPGPADVKIIAALTDDDAQVRQAGVRMAAQRRLAVAQDVMLRQVHAPDFANREETEIRSSLLALATLGGAGVVDVLDRILNPPLLQKGQPLLERLRQSVDAAADSQKVDLRMAAAAALGTVDHQAARDSLHQGARSLIPAVRQACLRALSGGGGEP